MINVTKPFLPPLSELLPYLNQIWDSKILSNNGPLHARLESSLSEFLGVPQVSLFCNATIALITAQQALGIKGQVITTPYSFVATSHALGWMGNEPVFADIDPDSLTLDPAAVEAAITEHTTAIMPLHCYGNTCDVDALQNIADRHNLKIIYDACHSFGVDDEIGSVLRHGDMSVVSLHATKVFNTFEGGMLISSNPEMKSKVDNLKNFGFVDETVVVDAGINGKMSEFSAAVGLLQLNYFEQILEARSIVDKQYRQRIDQIDGISYLEPVRQSRRNFAYFPIFVDSSFPITRDQLYMALREKNIYARRYFYPLISDFEMYKHIPSASAANLPVATITSSKVICLPLYPELKCEEVDQICDIIRDASRGKYLGI